MAGMVGENQAGEDEKSARAGAGPDLTQAALAHLFEQRLDFAGLASPGDLRLHGSEEGAPAALRDAAVLIGIVPRPVGLNVILTRRPDHLGSHPGQVAFPGGRIDPSDDGPIAAALREAEEEIGLSPSLVDVRGVLDPFATGTGFKVFPVVGFVDSYFVAKINADEVAEEFEVPFAFLMDPKNHLEKTAEFRGRLRTYYEMPYGGQRIWGATAHMIVKLYCRLYGTP
ncbi:MAG: CoA pyrophosphatase [Alphaproteobacteria bacterium]